MAKDRANSVTKRDDLDAARTIRDTLAGFTSEEQERILRWAGESLGIKSSGSAAPPTRQTIVAPPPASEPNVRVLGDAPKSINTFVDEKNPETDIQLAATIAYYYRFEAPENERRDEIDATFLRDALRLAGRPGQLVKPLTTLNNAHAKGLLDRGSTRGMFVINSVGENLVGMTLPGGAAQAPRQRAGKAKAPGKKAPKRTK
jgi:hypothetical protein